MSEVDYSIPSARRVLEGLQIILSVDPTARCEAQHDIFYCSEYESTYKKMSENERARMKQLGWFKDKDSESWGFFT